MLCEGSVTVSPVSHQIDLLPHWKLSEICKSVFKNVTVVFRAVKLLCTFLNTDTKQQKKKVYLWVLLGLSVRNKERGQGCKPVVSLTAVM